MELATQPVNKARDAYYWRLLATAISFALFGLVGLCLRLLVFPLLACWPGSAQAHRQRARRTVSWLFWLFIHVYFLIGFRNRLMVMTDWAWAYLTFKRSARVISSAINTPPAKPHDKHDEAPTQ